jgi:hypothetical protein
MGASGRQAPGGGAHHSEQRRHCKPLGAPGFPQNFSTGWPAPIPRRRREIAGGEARAAPMPAKYKSNAENI